MKRHGLVLGLGFVLLAGTISLAETAAEQPETRLQDRVVVLYHAPWAETMTVVDAGPGLIVVDSWGSLTAAKAARKRIEDLFHKRVHLVINTHHHWDHTFGNAAFKEAEIVGHRFCASDMQADYGDAKKRSDYFKENAASAQGDPLGDYMLSVGAESPSEPFPLTPPTRLVGERETLRLGDLSIILYHTPGIHTRSFLTIFIPELGLLFGRREFAEASKIKLEPGADPRPIRVVLEEIQKLKQPVRFLISGHGQPIATPDLNGAIEKLRGLEQKK